MSFASHTALSSTAYVSLADLLAKEECYKQASPESPLEYDDEQSLTYVTEQDYIGAMLKEAINDSLPCWPQSRDALAESATQHSLIHTSSSSSSSVSTFYSCGSWFSSRPSSSDRSKSSRPSSSGSSVRSSTTSTFRLDFDSDDDSDGETDTDASSIYSSSSSDSDPCFDDALAARFRSTCLSSLLPSTKVPFYERWLPESMQHKTKERAEEERRFMYAEMCEDP